MSAARLAHPAADTRGPRTRMVVGQLAGRGVRNQRVLAAMRWAPREWFLPPHLARDAYNDAPLPIGSGQTISQPFVVALMTERLDPRRTHRILEIGTGSGYQTAILASLAPTPKAFPVHRPPHPLVVPHDRFPRPPLPN